MNSLIDRLKYGIDNKDWETICQIYTYISGEDIEIPYDNDNQLFSKFQEFMKSVDNQKSKPIKKQSKKKVKNLIEKNNAEEEIKEEVKASTDVNIEYKDDDNVPLDPSVKKIKVDQIPNYSGPVKAQKIQIYSGAFSKAEAKKLADIAAKNPREYREPYKPVFKKCEDCDKKFDLNKAYPGGILDKSSSKLRCVECQNQIRK